MTWAPCLVPQSWREMAAIRGDLKPRGRKNHPSRYWIGCLFVARGPESQTCNKYFGRVKDWTKISFWCNCRRSLAASLENTTLRLLVANLALMGSLLSGAGSRVRSLWRIMQSPSQDQEDWEDEEYEEDQDQYPLGIWEPETEETAKWWRHSWGDKMICGVQEHRFRGSLEPNHVRTLKGKDCKFKYFFCAQAGMMLAENCTVEV